MKKILLIAFLFSLPISTKPAKAECEIDEYGDKSVGCYTYSYDDDYNNPYETPKDEFTDMYKDRTKKEDRVKSYGSRLQPDKYQLDNNSKGDSSIGSTVLRGLEPVR